MKIQQVENEAKAKLTESLKGDWDGSWDKEAVSAIHR